MDGPAFLIDHARHIWAPKVFLSHASEDKARFVLSFAEKLHNNGIDVWLDKWEMLLTC
jgi:hypothetical protein